MAGPCPLDLRTSLVRTGVGPLSEQLPVPPWSSLGLYTHPPGCARPEVSRLYLQLRVEDGGLGTVIRGAVPESRTLPCGGFQVKLRVIVRGVQ